MFCMECGTKLPDNAKFCMNCGTKVQQVSAPVAQKATAEEKPYEVRVPEFDFSFDAAPKAPVEETPYEVNIPDFSDLFKPEPGICSERNQSMVYVPDVGLFFIHNETSIVLLPVGEKKCKKVTWVKTSGLFIRSLAYYDNLLYYWIINDSDSVSYECKLMSLNPGTLEKKEVKEYSFSDVGRLYDVNNCIALHGDSYYCVSVGYDKELLNRIMLPEGQITSTELPDLRSKPLPADWQRDRYVSVTEETRKMRNYGEKLHTFRTVGGYGYLSISLSITGAESCWFLQLPVPARRRCWLTACFVKFAMKAILVILTIRFPLSDPDNFTFMPAESCTADENDPRIPVDGVLYNKDLTTLIQYPIAKEDESFTILQIKPKIIIDIKNKILGSLLYKKFIIFCKTNYSS
mgnify:CR=1 FL=1